MIDPESKFELALDQNYDNQYGTVPTQGTYPHIWPTDKTFAAIGNALNDPGRAAQDIELAFSGQWQNGMVPHQTYTKQPLRGPSSVANDKYMWWRQRPHDAPNQVRTSGVATLPVLAEGTIAVARQLSAEDRKPFLASVVPKIRDFHTWFYENRTFGHDGLVSSIHPYETSLNGLPYWTKYMLENPIGAIGSVMNRATQISERVAEHAIKNRRGDKTGDSKEVSISVQAGLLAVGAICPLSKTKYNTATIEQEWPYKIEDVLVNSVLVRNNRLLTELADEAGVHLDESLTESMDQNAAGLDRLFVHDSPQDNGHYYSRPLDEQHLPILTIASLAPVYSGAISNARIRGIISELENPETFNLPYPIPTTAANATPYFNSEKEDIGAVKPMANWLIGKGLLEANQKSAAKNILYPTHKMVQDMGFSKAYSSITGKPLDKNVDSATAAVALDALSQNYAQLMLVSLAIGELLKHAA